MRTPPDSVFFAGSPRLIGRRKRLRSGEWRSCCDKFHTPRASPSPRPFNCVSRTVFWRHVGRCSQTTQRYYAAINSLHGYEISSFVACWIFILTLSLFPLLKLQNESEIANWCLKGNSEAKKILSKPSLLITKWKSMSGASQRRKNYSISSRHYRERVLWSLTDKKWSLRFCAWKCTFSCIFVQKCTFLGFLCHPHAA